jgi:hypothetical protein
MVERGVQKENQEREVLKGVQKEKVKQKEKQEKEVLKGVQKEKVKQKEKQEKEVLKGVQKEKVKQKENQERGVLKVVQKENRENNIKKRKSFFRSKFKYEIDRSKYPKIEKFYNCVAELRKKSKHKRWPKSGSKRESMYRPFKNACLKKLNLKKSK